MARPASVQGCHQEGSSGLITNLCLAAQAQSLVLCLWGRLAGKGKPILNYDEGIGSSRKLEGGAHQVRDGAEKGTGPANGGACWSVSPPPCMQRSLISSFTDGKYPLRISEGIFLPSEVDGPAAEQVTLGRR